MLTLLTTVLLLFSINRSAAQDYIITWDDDTLFCRLPAKPVKEGFRPRGHHKNGYARIVAVFPNDSIRVFKPGEIKGYYREKHGQSLLCDGRFHSVKVKARNSLVTDAEGKKTMDPAWHFMVLEEEGTYASMYKLLVIDRGVRAWYYIIKHTGEKEPEGLMMTTKRVITEHLAEKDIADEMAGFIKKNRSYRKMMKEYNRLKHAAVKGD